MPRAKPKRYFAGGFMGDEVTFTPKQQDEMLEQLNLEDDKALSEAQCKARAAQRVHALAAIKQAVKLYHVDVTITDKSPRLAAIAAELKRFQTPLEALYQLPTLSEPSRDALCAAGSAGLPPDKAVERSRWIDGSLRALGRNIKTLTVALEGTLHDLHTESRGRPQKSAFHNLLTRLLQIFRKQYAQDTPTSDAFHDFAQFVLRTSKVPHPGAQRLRNQTRTLFRDYPAHE